MERISEIYYLAGNIEYVYGPQNFNYEATIQSKLWQKYQSISIALGVSIHTALDKKWSVQNDFAFYISPFQNNVGRKVIRTTTDYYVFDNQNYESKTFFSLGNQLLLNYKIAPRFIVQMHADGANDLRSRLKTDLHYNLGFSHIGAGLGGKFMF